MILLLIIILSLLFHNNFDNKTNLPYFTYDDLNKTIHILLTDNNFPTQLYYHYKNSSLLMVKLFLVYIIIIILIKVF